MTQDELEQLPEVGGIGQETREIDGKKVVIPVLGKVFALFHKEDDPLLIVDRNGVSWSVGWHENVRYKRQVRQ